MTIAAETYVVHRLSGQAMKNQFINLGTVPGYNRIGGKMLYSIGASGTLDIQNLDKRGRTSGAYRVMEAESQICIEVAGGEGWKPMQHCYHLLQISANTFVMRSVEDNYFFTYSTSWTPDSADALPVPSSFADVKDGNALPFIGAKGRDRYRDYLAAPSPKAFAISPKGDWRLFSGDPAAMRKALVLCMGQSGTPCWLYAVDDKVVWQPEESRRVSLDQLRARTPASAAIPSTALAH